MHRGMKGTLDAKAKADATGDEGLKILGFGKHGNMTWRDMATSIQPKHVDYCRWLLERDDIQPESAVDAFSATEAIQPCSGGWRWSASSDRC